MSVFATTTLGNVITRIKNEVVVRDDETYARLTIRMNGRGIDIRDKVSGFEIGTKRQFVANSGQLVLSKIDARNGAFGVLPQHCDNAIITGNFWAFEVDHQRLVPQYFDYLTKTPMFIDFCVRASEGTTNRRYLQESAFLSQEIPLPSLDEQRRIVARIEELAVKVEEARGLRAQAMEELEAVRASAVNDLFSDSNMKGVSVIELEHISEIRAGVTLGRKLVGKTIRLPYLRVANVQDGRLDLRVLKEVEVYPDEIQKWSLRRGDLLLTEGGDWDKLGRGTVWQDEVPDCIHQNHIFRVRVDQTKFDPWYVSALMSTPRGKEYFRAASKQTTNLASINQRQLKSFPILALPLERQRAILVELETLQAKVHEVESIQTETAAELDAMLPAVLAKAFNGEL